MYTPMFWADSYPKEHLPNQTSSTELHVDGVAMVRLLGPQDRLLSTLETQFPLVEVLVRGNEISLSGDSEQVAAGEQRHVEGRRHLGHGLVEVDDRIVDDDAEPGLAVLAKGEKLHVLFHLAKGTCRWASFSRADGGAEMPQWSTRPGGHFQSSGPRAT